MEPYNQILTTSKKEANSADYKRNTIRVDSWQCQNPLRKNGSWEVTEIYISFAMFVIFVKKEKM